MAVLSLGPIAIRAGLAQRACAEQPKQQDQWDGNQQPPQTPSTILPGGVAGPRGGRGLSHRVGHLKSGQRRCQFRRLRAELLGGLVPRDLAAAESLRDGVTVDGRLPGGHTEFPGGAAEFGPGGVDRTADHDGAGVGSPEDDRLVRRAEGAHPTVGHAAVGLGGDRVAEIAAGPADRLVLGQDGAGDRVCAGLRGVEDLAAGVPLGRPVVTDRGLLALPRPQWSAKAATGPPREVDHGGGVQGNLKAGQAVGQPRRIGGEGIAGPIPRHLTAGELLTHQVAVVTLVLDWHSQRPGRAAEFVPGGIDGAADGPRAGIGGPEDRRLVAGAERTHPAVRSDQAGDHVDVREAEIAVGGATERLVFVQDRPVQQVRAGGGFEEDLAVGELLAVSGAHLVDVAVLAAYHRTGSAGGVPGRVDRVGGVALRRGERGGHHQCRRSGRGDQSE